MSDHQQLINKIWSDQSFPTHPRIQIGTTPEKAKDGKIIEKPIYSFFLKKEDAYYCEIDNKIKCNFVGEYNQKNMRYSFHYDNPTDPKFNPHLIVGTEFI